ncbi:MAG: hypothetical protein ACR2HG_04870 [Pyrinomonadaceae bacterium]
MKEEYLWDKTGSDPEIERLENAPKAFRYTETAPPALPAKIIPFERKSERKFFRLILAFAACAALVIIALGVWLKIPSGKIEVAKDSTKTFARQVDEKNSDTIPIGNPGDLVVKKVAIPKRSVEPKAVKIRKTVPIIARQNKIVAQNIKVKKPTVKFTKEEIYAYDQLMLALSITSSKLKLVKDKVNNVEEKTIVPENGQ